MVDEMIQEPPHNGVQVMGVAVGHEHRESTGCADDCSYRLAGSTGWRVYPDRWPENASVVVAELEEIRRSLTRLRGRIDNEIAAVGDSFDATRSLRDSRGSIQGAIVMLYNDLQRWESTAAWRGEIDERLPPLGPPLRPGCCAPTEGSKSEHSPLCRHWDATVRAQ